MGRYTAARDLDLRVRKTWYLVANRAEARIYEDVPRRGFGLVSKLDNPEARLMESDLDSDRPGSVVSSSPGRNGRGTFKHGLGRGSVHKENLALRFAGRINRQLEQGAHEARFVDLVLVAEPGFLGLLRGTMSRSLQKLVGRVLGREFPSHVSERELRVILRQSS
jgi:protein required for attachment to host cells